MPLDDITCAACGASVFEPEVPSFSVVQWIPETRSNVFVAVYCGEHLPSAQLEGGDGLRLASQ